MDEALDRTRDHADAEPTPPADAPSGDAPAGGRVARRRGVSRRKVVGAGVAGAAVLSTGAAIALTRPPGHLPWGDPARAFPVNAFTDSVGVNVHLSYGDTPYADLDAVRAALRRAGIRHVRDGWDREREDVAEAFRTLVADGVRLDLIVGTPGPGGAFASELRRQLEGMVSLLPTGIRSLEGPNEYDLSDDPDWVENLSTYHHSLAELVADGVPGYEYDLVAPSFVHGDSRERVGRLPADFGNLHSYTGGDQPTERHLDDELTKAALVAGEVRTMATETGFNTAVNNDDGQPGVPEEVTGTYVPRQFLENFRRGVTRTFTYELLDQYENPDLDVSESNYGLLRNDFSEKPGFTALAGMMALLADEPGGHITHDLPHEVEVSADAPLRRLLLQKSTGEYYLALWLEASVWNYDAGEPIEPVTAQARVLLPEGASAVALLDAAGETVTGDLSGRDVTVTVSPAAQFLQISAD